MKHTISNYRTFVPVDVQRIVTRLKTTWLKLSDEEIDYYRQGKRNRFLVVLQTKYNFSEEQAEMTLSCIERLS